MRFDISEKGKIHMILSDTPGGHRTYCLNIHRGETWPENEQESFMNDIRQQYEHQGHPYFASARLWDDGVIDPVDTRRILGLALNIACREPMQPSSSFGVFRM